MPCGGLTPTNQSYERWPSTALCVPTGLSNIWYCKDNIQAAKQEPSITWLAIMCDCVICCDMGLLRSLHHAVILHCDLGPWGPFFTLMLCCRTNIIGTCITQPKIARIISIASGALWWQYATYASACIMTKASSGYRLCYPHFVCHTLEGVDSLHCPRLTAVSLPREAKHLSMNCFQFYPSRLLSDDMSMVGWSLVKLALLLCCTFFMLIAESSCGTCFAAFRKNSFACYPLLSVAFIFMMSLILFRHFGRRYPFLSGQMPSYHVVRRQGFHSHILVTLDLLCELSLAR